MRFVSLYAFNLLVLWLIGLLMSSVRVGWSAFWAAIILTAATLWIKPVLSKVISGAAARSADSRTRAGQKLVQYGIVFVVELIVWILVVIFSGVRIGGLFWGWALPPVLLLIAWAIYDAIDDRVEKTAGELYDSATGRAQASGGGSAPAATGTVQAPDVSAELNDGLTPEQRRMLDDLGKS